MFHFIEVKQAEKEKRQQENTRFDILLGQIEAAGLIGHPKTDRESVMNMIRERKLKAEGVATVEEVMEYLKENDDIFPQTITVNTVVPDEEARFILPKRAVKLKPGILVDK